MPNSSCWQILRSCTQGTPDASCFELVTEHVHPRLLVGKHQHIASVNEPCNVAHQPLLFWNISSNHLHNLRHPTGQEHALYAAACWQPLSQCLHMQRLFFGSKADLDSPVMEDLTNRWHPS